MNLQRRSDGKWVTEVSGRDRAVLRHGLGYLFAHQQASSVCVYGYLDRAEAPRLGTNPIQGVDGIEISVLFDFGVGAIDWRGEWFSPGT